MYPEYLQNNDTQDMRCRVQKLAQNNEPALRAHCQEVSRQTDTSSLAAKEACANALSAAGASLTNLARVAKMLSKSLSSDVAVFRTRDGQADFGTVCRAVTEIEDVRQELLVGISHLAQARQVLAASVADANRALHLLSLAKQAVSKEAYLYYEKDFAHLEDVYAHLTELDNIAREALSAYMTFVERHLPTFMQSLRSAADFNHAGAALDRALIRRLCQELLILVERTQNVCF